MERGTRIYYTGDMANIEDFGTISRVVHSPRWGTSYDIVLDDGRLLRGISPMNFAPSPGRRFWPLNEWEARRTERIADMQKRYHEVLAQEA